MTDTVQLDLFEIKQKFLREVPHPKLIFKEIKYINRKMDIEGPDTLKIQEVRIDSALLNESLDSFLERHIADNLKLKHKIANTQDYSGLKIALYALLEHQVLLLNKLSAYLPVDEELTLDEVKVSTPIDTYYLLKSFQSLDLKENEIKNYLCIQLRAEKMNDQHLIAAFLRARKIIKNG